MARFYCLCLLPSLLLGFLTASCAGGKDSAELNGDAQALQWQIVDLKKRFKELQEIVENGLGEESTCSVPSLPDGERPSACIDSESRSQVASNKKAKCSHGMREIGSASDETLGAQRLYHSDWSSRRIASDDDTAPEVPALPGGANSAQGNSAHLSSRRASIADTEHTRVFVYGDFETDESDVEAAALPGYGRMRTDGALVRPESAKSRAGGATWNEIQIEVLKREILEEVLLLMQGMQQEQEHNRNAAVPSEALNTLKASMAEQLQSCSVQISNATEQRNRHLQTVVKDLNQTRSEALDQIVELRGIVDGKIAELNRGQANLGGRVLALETAEVARSIWEQDWKDEVESQLKRVDMRSETQFSTCTTYQNQLATLLKELVEVQRQAQYGPLLEEIKSLVGQLQRMHEAAPEATTEFQKRLVQINAAVERQEAQLASCLPKAKLDLLRDYSDSTTREQNRKTRRHSAGQALAVTYARHNKTIQRNGGINSENEEEKVESPMQDRAAS